MKKSIKILTLSLLVLLLVSACSSPKSSVKITDVHEKVKRTLGDAYVPSMPLDEEGLKTMLGVNMDNVQSFVAETPMISVHIDTFVAIEAKAGKGELVEKDLIAYRDDLLLNGFMYPINIAKAHASQVVRHGDYVFFVMLGAFDERGEVTEADALEFAKAENQKAVDVVNSFFE